MTKFLTLEQTKRNRPRNLERQRILSKKFPAVKVGNPWGPWQQKLWKEYIKEAPLSKDNKEARDKLAKHLDTWIKQNPEYKGIKTNDFRNFLINLARTESTYNPTAKHKKQYGYFQILNLPEGTSAPQQIKAAYDHLKTLFKESITKQDVYKAREQGITDGELLAKYWNQQNRVTNYIHRGIDSADGHGTLVSTYHNNSPISIDYLQYLPNAITASSVKATSPTTLSDAIRLARNDSIDYSNREQYVLDLNRELKKDSTWDDRKVQLNEPIYLYE